jgi:hypothetical protein
MFCLDTLEARGKIMNRLSMTPSFSVHAQTKFAASQPQKNIPTSAESPATDASDPPGEKKTLTGDVLLESLPVDIHPSKKAVISRLVQLYCDGTLG